jgi:hypothetical protein
MGGLFNKKETVIGPQSKVGIDSVCPICSKFFSKSTTYFEYNLHKDQCYSLRSRPKIKRELHVEEIENIFGEIENLRKLNNQINDNTGHQISQNNPRNSKIIVKPFIKNNNSNALNNNKNVQSSNNNQNKYRPSNKKKNSLNVLNHNNDHLNEQPFFLSSDFQDFNEYYNNNNLNDNPVNKNNKQNISKPNKPIKKQSFIHEMSNFSIEYMKDFPFDMKVVKFKQQLQSLKVDWREGYCTLELDRENFLKQSIVQFNKIDPYKELHINFNGEISHDAGGIIREWFTIIFKELHKEDLSNVNLI